MFESGVIERVFELIQDGKLSQARIICQELRQKFGEHATILFLLGTIAIKSKAPADALPYLRRAIDLEPEDLEFRKVLGTALQDQEQPNEALVHYKYVLDVAPDTPKIIYKSAQCHELLGRIDEAIEALRTAVSLNPAFYPAVLKLAQLMRAEGDTKAAVKEIRELSNLRGDLTFEAMCASWILPVVPRSKEEMDDARERYQAATMALELLKGSIDEKLLLGTTTNFMAVYQGLDDRRYQEAIASFFRTNCPSLSYRAPHLEQGLTTTSSQTKIRIGFVSTNFYNHTVGKLFRGIIAELNSKVFDVFVFGGQEKDEIARFIKNNCYQFHELPHDLPEARRVITNTRLDIIVYADIGMSPLTYFLAFSRLARVQCAGWGHGVTTGLTSLDYFISSFHLQEADFEKAQSHYSEKLLRLTLPPTYLYPIQKPKPDDIPDLSFADGKTRYVCLQSLFKIHPDFDSILVEILCRDPNGICIFIDGRAGWSEILRSRWEKLSNGINTRIYFLPRLDQNGFLALINAADVILDTIFCCGGISSAEALSQGTPIVTWPNSELLFAKVTTAYYEEIGIMDCIAKSGEDYVAKSVRLGTDRAWRKAVSQRISEQNHLLFKRREVLDELEIFFKSSLD